MNVSGSTEMPTGDSCSTTEGRVLRLLCHSYHTRISYGIPILFKLPIRGAM